MIIQAFSYPGPPLAFRNNLILPVTVRGRDASGSEPRGGLSGTGCHEKGTVTAERASSYLDIFSGGGGKRRKLNRPPPLILLNCQHSVHTETHRSGDAEWWSLPRFFMILYSAPDGLS